MNQTRTYLASLQQALIRLDHRLRRAIDIARTAHASTLHSDPFRGLYISEEEIDRLLARKPGEPLLWSGHPDGLPALAPEHPARRVQECFGLSDFEMDVLLVAFAVEVDLRYERLYAWLHDDATRRRPSVALALDLLCESAEERVARRAEFADDAPLIRSGMIRWGSRADDDAPLLARELVLDEAAVRFLFEQSSEDRRLKDWCRWVTPELSLGALPVSASVRRQIEAAMALRTGLYHFHGPSGAGRRQAAEAIAFELDRTLIVADIARLDIPALERKVKVLALEASLRQAVIYVTGVDALMAAGQTSSVAACLEILDGAPVLAIIGATGSSLPPPARDRLFAVEFDRPDAQARFRWWSNRARAHGFDIEERPIALLAKRYCLDLNQIADAVAMVESLGRHAEVVDHTAQALPLDEAMSAARRVSARGLQGLAQAIEPVRRWSDIVLPEATLIQLGELRDRIATRHEVLDDWGFRTRLSSGTGCNALFAGPPGTGKTLAAEVIAREMELNLYRIDLSSVVSKYIGDTEKNLERIFAAAERANAVLVFDEADALFGKRSAVRDSHDRYANVEISFLLQRMEQYDGVAILATNLAQNLDEAFVRRLAFTIHFPFPKAEFRARIWARIWPETTPLDEEVDHDWLARAFKLSGGNIKNAALAAASLAAAKGTKVTLAHLRQAIRREFEKMGKAMTDEELGIQPPPFQLVGAQ